MSSSADASGSPSSLPRLGPTWSKGGRGFQPPPPAESLTRSRSGSAGSSGSESKPNANKFAVLDDDDEVNSRPPNSRSEALRSFHRSSSSGPKPTGRSLADLAARTPSVGISRSSSAPFREEASTGGGRFSNLSSSADGEGASTAKVIRITREKLLALRKPPGPNDPNPPQVLKHVEGSPILSPEAQDPVCWDNFDPDEIWDQVPRDRLPRSSSIGGPKGPPSRMEPPDDKNRRASTGGGDRGGGRWQRGVALPPPDENANRRRSQAVDAENPNDLWDDPVAGPSGAASDFSAFGAIPDEPNHSGGGGSRGSDAFDFEKMTEATNRFEMERRGSKGSDALSEGEEEANVHSMQVNPHRPLASTGTTIQSGSGDDVNVFEDFDTPGESEESDAAVKGANEDTSASSRLMKMIGVSRAGTDDTATDATTSETADSGPSETVAAAKAVDSWDLTGNGTHVQDSKAGVIPSNPWGSLMGSTSNHQQQGTMDLAARMEAEQKARDAQITAEMERRKAQDAERLRRQQEEEEAKRRASKPQPPSQVELVLIERISTFLENSWGRSDLVSILSTLHAEDSRVIPLLGNVDALRALVARHPSRIGLRHDPAFGSEMAVLLLTNAQWAKQEHIARQEEIQQQEMQQRIELQRREEAMRQAAQKSQGPVVSPDAPWFYSDPQNNVQGPFRGEEMRQWLEAGYFKGDLPISQQQRGPFVPLQALFPDLSVAFRFPGDEANGNNAALEAAEQEKQRAREEEERRAAEIEKRVQAEARAAEAERREREALGKERAAAKEQQNQSTQLKMMLGMGRSGSSGGRLDEPTQEQPPEAPPRKTQETAQLRQKAPQPSPAAAPVTSASPAWGGASSAAPRRKSMAEIQQEEARAAARLAMERKHNPSSSSGWANVAASKGGSSGWQSGTVKPTPAASVTNPNATMAAATRTMRPSQASSSREASASQRSRGSISEKPADDFGASMPPALENWCKDQMKKLNGSDDLTLVSFCMTLSDADEIRQYLTAYLGSTPQVNNFATEFISRKNGGKAKQDEWESATKGKKGKKKK